MVLMLGKKPARPGAVSFKFHDYVDITQMAPPPDDFGHENMVKDWGMLGNDRAGCCYWSGAAHETMLWNFEAGVNVPFSAQTVLGNYAEGTNIIEGSGNGYNVTTGANDNGTDVAAALELRRTTGLFDDTGKRHTIGAYVALNVNVDELKYAAYYFDGIGIGVQFPNQWMDAFNSGNYVWDAVQSPDYEGGHYISCVAWRKVNPVIITWGQPVELTLDGFRQNCDEVYAYLSMEKLVNGVDFEGLNVDKMIADLGQLRSIQ